MGFKFTYLCDLLAQLESARVAKAASSAKRVDPDVSVVTLWFNRHQKQIHDGCTDRLALLSCLFPERRPDRVYGLQEPSLVKVIGRCLLLGSSRKQQLDQWRRSGGADLGQCVENVVQLAESDVRGLPEITVEEVDCALNRVASRSRFSGPSVRRNRSAADVDETLGPILRRLSARDAKWLTRMILKDLSPLTVPSALVLKTFHFLLPNLLALQDSFEAALNLLDAEPIKSFPSRPSRDFADYLTQEVLPDLPPKIGVKIGRPAFDKARSLHHCCSMARKRKMSLERKYDGEYCQIHIDLSKGPDCIQIFSKSGKDSTKDRRQVHDAIKKCLNINTGECYFSNICILEGEILVWGGYELGILSFDNLRKHIPRSGTLLGAENDYPPSDNERLCIVFFDVLLVDNNVCLYKPYTERRQTLGKVVSTIDGLGGLSEQRDINFSLPTSREELRDLFAMGVAQRWEGIILKACDEPYLTLRQRSTDHHSGHWIKFKKDYITGLADTADFALVGARYDACDAVCLQDVKPMLWTSFFVGCLEKRQDVGGRSTTAFRIVDIIGRSNMHVQHIRTLNQHGQFHAQDADSENLPFTIQIPLPQLPKLDVVFKKPFVVEMSGSGFERPQNARYFTLRFPRILKIHTDRTFQDATSFDDLQRLAESARSVPVDEFSQEAAEWAARLDPTDKRSEYVGDHSGTSSMSRTSSESPRSNNSDYIPGSRCVDNASNDLWAPSLHRQSVQSEAGWQTFSGTYPTEAVKKRKLSSQSSPTMEVLQDPLDSAELMNATSIRNASDHCLAELSNILVTKSQQNPASRGVETQSFYFSHKSTPRSALSAMDINGEHSPALSGGCSSQPFQKDPLSFESATSHTSLHRQIKQPLRCTPHAESSGRQTHWSRFAKDIPFLLSTQIPQGKRSRIQQYLCRSNLHCTTSKPEFLSTMSKGVTPSTRHASPFPHHQSLDVCRHGVVLVNSDTLQVDNVATDITAVGNALASFHRSAELAGSGKIIFLHWKVLRYRLFSRNDGLDADKDTPSAQWKQIGERVFAGCLKWDKGMLPQPKRRRRELFGGGGGVDRRSSGNSDGKDEANVAVSWNWEESLSLFPASWPDGH